MFVDASALVAILAREPDWGDLAQSLDQASQPTTSALAIYEAVLALARLKGGTLAEVRADVGAFLAAAGIAVLAIEAGDADAALAAFERYGKGRGHPARLNMGDCFAYALARRHRVPLLYKGDDFGRTDVNAGFA